MYFGADVEGLSFVDSLIIVWGSWFRWYTLFVGGQICLFDFDKTSKERYLKSQWTRRIHHPQFSQLHINMVMELQDYPTISHYMKGNPVTCLCAAKFFKNFLQITEFFRVRSDAGHPGLQLHHGHRRHQTMRAGSWSRSHRMVKWPWQFCWWPFWDGENVTLFNGE